MALPPGPPANPLFLDPFPDVVVPPTVYTGNIDVDHPNYFRVYFNAFYHQCETLMKAQQSTLLASLAAARITAPTTTDLGERYLAAAPTPQDDAMYTYILAVQDAHEARMLTACWYARLYNNVILQLEGQQQAMLITVTPDVPADQVGLLAVPRVRPPIPPCQRTICTVCYPPDP